MMTHYKQMAENSESFSNILVSIFFSDSFLFLEFFTSIALTENEKCQRNFRRSFGHQEPPERTFLGLE